MFVVLGLIILVAAVVVGVAGLLGNAGSAHALTPGDFTVFGYHVTGSTGTLFLSGIVVGAAAMLGLSLLLTGSRRAARRAQAARRGLSESQRRTAAISRDRDDLIVQRETARTDTAPTQESSPTGGTPGQGHRSRHRWRLFGHPVRR
ncbi:hypothetical protein [Streptomyces sp. NBC_00996]|uniref:hypothetical protein n=1 Tax=Streptomyces sp. NBC_00996 TaxID=2903710 RepID=UPI003866CE8E|nr:hypothetical protein OG390_00855 [Streptomyces sp. NBC_00996]